MSTDSISPLRARMIEDMNARKLCAGTQRGHLRGCKRFAAFLKRSPETATAEDIRRFQLHLAEARLSICTRNQIMTGVRFLLRVTLRRLDLVSWARRRYPHDAGTFGGENKLAKVVGFFVGFCLRLVGIRPILFRFIPN